MPSFIAYAAYCGCAIQIPFLWCSNQEVRRHAIANVGANIKMIETMATYWKIAALLKIHVRCLYNIYKRNPVALEDEPKNIAVAKLINFKVEASRARSSILDPVGVVHSKEDNGLAKQGEESLLGADSVNSESDDEESPTLALVASDGK
jgi:hypothetical protein